MLFGPQNFYIAGVILQFVLYILKMETIMNNQQKEKCQEEKRQEEKLVTRPKLKTEKKLEIDTPRIISDYLEQTLQFM